MDTGADEGAEERGPRRLSAGVRFRTPGRIHEVDPGPLVLARDDRVVVETEHGPALATVVIPPRPHPGKNPPERRVVKKADARDLAREDANLQREREAYRLCLERVRARGLPMKLVRAEVPFDGSKVIFSFAAEGRVDFRELVRELAQALHTRAEMRQVGARDGARLVGAVGPCGRELCCTSWLGTFQAVAVKMAKEQGLSLNPDKLAGMCGRLKCCLRYEYDTYLALKRGLPRAGARVRSTRGDGRVVRHNSLRQTVVVKRDEDGLEVEVGLEELVGKRREGGTNGGGCRAAMPATAAEPASGQGDRGRSRCAGATLPEPVYLTTPIYYVNAEPHLGHTYTTVVADTLARFYRARGRETFFLTGTDEHGDKIAQAAAAAGVEPAAYVDRMSGIFRSTWDACAISYDHFIRTTDAEHVTVVQEVLAAVHRAGDIRFGAYTGRYCFGCERFYTERELVDGLCPDHREPPALISEENYFFRMSRYQDRLRRLLEERPDLIVPEGYRNEVLAMLREPLEDLCISRPKSRLSWGIELPFDCRYVTYVWFDALLNYVSALRARRGEVFTRLWPAATHLIAKDILKPHAIYWPTLLMAAGLPVFRRLCVHGYWIMEQGKMSKSLGNVVRPLEVKARYGMDAFRYFLLREMAFGQDATFSEDALVARINADLANGLGNLASRVLAMQQRYFAGAVQPLGAVEAADGRLRDAFARAAREVPAHVEALAFHRALEALWRAIDEANRYIVETAPFKVARRAGGLPRAGSILHHLCEALRSVAELIGPFMPETAARLERLLALDPGARGRPWGAGFAPGHRTCPPEALFPRVAAPPA